MARPPVFVKCRLCKKDFKRKALRNKFCSQSCAWKGRPKAKGRPQERIILNCDSCGKEIFRRPCHIIKSVNKKFYCNVGCRKFAMKFIGTNYGFKKSSNSPLNPYKRCVKNGKFVYEHRWVMEQHLNRKLERKEHVHHINGNQKDNRIENLQILSSSQHAQMHRKQIIEK